MLTYGFFNAVYTEGIPDRSYTADNLAEFFDSIIGDGVSADIQDGFKVVASSGMQVNLNPGFCWIHGYYAKNTSVYPLVVSAAPPTDTRIDAVVLRWSRADRNILPQVLTGVASPNPQRPQIVRNADIYDLLLGYITLSAGESAITSGMITDTRADMDVCGIIDTFASRLLPDGSVTHEKLASNAVKLEFTNVTIAPEVFVSDTTYVDYPYRANLALNGVISSMIPEVIFGMTEAISGNFAPVVESYDGGVYIYASSVPESAITIPTIILWRGNAT